jgi:DNA-binding IclR family transcriptional regulator
MPIFRGAASKMILANLPSRALRRHFEQSGQAIREAGLGEDWKTFNANLRRLRQKGVCVTYSEIDVGVVGISSPIFTPDSDILGSIGLVVPHILISGDEARLSDLSDRVIHAGMTVTQALRTDNV